MLFWGERPASKRSSSILDEHSLNSNGKYNDYQEEPVVKERCENIVLVSSKLSRVDFIEYLHHNECLENQSVVNSLVDLEKQNSRRYSIRS